MKKVSPVRVGFIGQGKHALTNLYPSLPHAGIDLVATCARHNADYTDYKRMLDTVKLDGVICCVNAEVHFEVAWECVQRGIPVFVEKPPACDSIKAKQLVEGNIMVGFNKRFSPIYMEAHKLIPKPLTITVNVNVGKCKDLKTLLMEVGIHYVDLCRYFGSEGSLQISDKLSWENATEHIEILGWHELVIINNGQLTYIKEKLTRETFGFETYTMGPNRVVPNIENHTIFTNGYVGELQHFADRIRKKKKPTPNMYDGYLALEKIEEML